MGRCTVLTYGVNAADAAGGLRLARFCPAAGRCRGCGRRPPDAPRSQPARSAGRLLVGGHTRAALPRRNGWAEYSRPCGVRLQISFYSIRQGALRRDQHPGRRHRVVISERGTRRRSREAARRSTHRGECRGCWAAAQEAAPTASCDGGALRSARKQARAMKGRKQAGRVQREIQLELLAELR